MNTRITELETQSYVECSRLEVDPPSGYLVEVTSKQFSREKFAELIIRECMSLCAKVEHDDELSDYAGGFKDGALLCQREIQDHFGIGL